MDAYTLVSGYDTNDRRVTLPSYNFPYFTGGGTPVTWRGNTSQPRNVETGGYISYPAGGIESGFAEALMIAQKYTNPQIFQVKTEQQQYTDTVAALQKEQAQLEAKSEMLQSTSTIWSSPEVLQTKVEETTQAIADFNQKVQALPMEPAPSPFPAASDVALNQPTENPPGKTDSGSIVFIVLILAAVLLIFMRK